MLKLPSPPYTLEFINECDPADTGRPDSMIYERYYTLNTQNVSGCRFGVRVKLGSDLQASCLVMSNGAMFKIDSDSVIVYRQRCVLAVGPHVAALSVPSLDLVWSCEVAWFGIVGIYYLPSIDSIVVHGETEVARLSMEGVLLWNHAAADLLTNGFEIREGYVHAVDWDNREYKIDLETGENRAGE